MLQCKDCEHFSRDDKGRIQLRCDPFATIKEPECIQKWQLLRQDALLQSYHAMLSWYQKMAPMQEKMFDFMKRELDDQEDGDSWKYQDDDSVEPLDPENEDEELK